MVTLDYIFCKSKIILKFFHIELLNWKIKKKELELVTRFVMSWCVTRFCNSGIIDPYQSCFKTAKVYLKVFLKSNHPVFSFVNSYKSSPIQMADVIENNRFLKAPGKKYTFSKCYRNLNILEIFWVSYTKNKLPIIFTKYKKHQFPTLIEI